MLVLNCSSPKHATAFKRKKLLFHHGSEYVGWNYWKAEPVDVRFSHTLPKALFTGSSCRKSICTSALRVLFNACKNVDFMRRRYEKSHFARVSCLFSLCPLGKAENVLVRSSSPSFSFRELNSCFVRVSCSS